MSLAAFVIVVGPMQNNAVFIVDESTRNAVVIDPSFDAQQVHQEAEKHTWNLRQIWLTHGHFDHTAGVAALSQLYEPALPIAMAEAAFDYTLSNPVSLPAYLQADGIPQLDIALHAGDHLTINPDNTGDQVEVRDVSGHSPGSLLYYIASSGVAIVGDAIFRESIGRTDLPGSDHQLLIKNIRQNVFSLPDQTLLIPGHGEQTTVAHEKANNPFF